MNIEATEAGEQPVYRIVVDDAASKDFSKLTAKAKGQVGKLIDTLAINPHGGNVRELVGFKGVYRKRMGDYRVIYMIEEGVLVVIVVAVGSRKDIYDLLKRRIR